MIVAIQQPNYLPWLGFFGKVLDADVFVLLDTVQFTKGGYGNRVQVKGPQGPQWFTQPVHHTGVGFQDVRCVEFAGSGWGEKHLKTLQGNYAKALYLRDYIDELGQLLTEPGPLLADCNARLIHWVAEKLGAKARIVRASELGIGSLENPTDRLVWLVQALGGDTYLSGQGGFKYMDLGTFEAAGIRLLKSRALFPEYPQLWGPFAPGLSIIDLLLNCGPNSRKVIEQGSVA